MQKSYPVIACRVEWGGDEAKSIPAAPPAVAKGMNEIRNEAYKLAKIKPTLSPPRCMKSLMGRGKGTSTPAASPTVAKEV